MAAREFISCAHKDQALLNELAAQLKILERNGLIEHWHDRELADAKAQGPEQYRMVKQFQRTRTISVPACEQKKPRRRSK
jgi:hypothetical protein